MAVLKGAFNRGVAHRYRVQLFDVDGDPITNITGAAFYVVPADGSDDIANAIGPDGSGNYSWPLTYNASAVDENNVAVPGAYDGTLPQEVGAKLIRGKAYRCVPSKAGTITSAPEVFNVR